MSVMREIGMTDSVRQEGDRVSVAFLVTVTKHLTSCLRRKN